MIEKTKTRYSISMSKNKVWEQPEIKEIGDAVNIIQDIDVDGTGDAGFPNNLQSDGV